MKRLTSLLLLVLIWSACQPEGHPKGWQPLDLLPYGAPLTIMAPPGAEVKQGRMNSNLFKDVIIKGGDDYNVQLFIATALTNDIARLKNEQLSIVKRNRYFRRVVREDAAGFIYQMMIDSLPSYGFRFVKIQGDGEYTFQTGMGNIFTQEEAQLMYEAVK
ncbi:MAG: hypothetical protein KDC54_23660 [Lewinella sp.]|nr:hypothetical protein [Lewinella sp.]